MFTLVKSPACEHLSHINDFIFYKNHQIFLQVSSSAGSVRGAQSQGSGGSRNPNRMSAAPILGTSAITSPAGDKTFKENYFIYLWLV